MMRVHFLPCSFTSLISILCSSGVKFCCRLAFTARCGCGGCGCDGDEDDGTCRRAASSISVRFSRRARLAAGGGNPAAG